MPTYLKGNMWDRLATDTEFVITTNPIINKRGLAVMGAGAAKAAAMMWPQSPRDFGFILERTKDQAFPNFGLINSYQSPLNTHWIRLYYFMVKNDWKEAADVERIKASVSGLRETALELPSRVFNLNYPGIGNGRLTKEQVAPLLEVLPPNVHIWEYANDTQ